VAFTSFTFTDRKDLLTKIAALGTSYNLSAPAIAAAGTGYAIGNVLSLNHAGGYLAATIEVLTVGGAGEILTIAQRNYGAYADRAASAVVVAGGTGYVVGDIIELQGGTPWEKSKFTVATLAGSAVATVTVAETGGAYPAAGGPGAGAATVLVGPSGGVGTGCTLTATYTGLVGTAGLAGTGGAGAGATFNVTRAHSGWTSLRNRNNYSFNGVLTEKEVALQGGVTPGMDPIIMARTYTATVGVNTAHGVLWAGATAWNDSFPLESQPGRFKQAVPVNQGGNYLLVFNASSTAWVAHSNRRFAGVVKCVGASTTSYLHFYEGLGNPYGTATESPYPLMIACPSGAHNHFPDSGGSLVTGLSEALRNSSAIGSPITFRRAQDAAAVDVHNGTAFAGVGDLDNVMYPLGETRQGTNPSLISGEGAFTFYNGISVHTGGAATRLLFPAPGGDLFLLVPLTVVSTPTGSPTFDVDLQMELEGVFFVSATKSDGTAFTSEDTLTIGSTRYRVFGNAARVQRYSYMALRES
jgi:hypothetical protein